LMARLARLDARDRAWLLGELPPALRQELALELGGEAPAFTSAAPAPGAGWESLDAEAVAGVLALEPAWLVSAATRSCDTQWRERLLAGLPQRRRQEVEYADRAGRPLNARAARLVLEACRERLAITPLRAAVPARHGFAALVQQMRARFS